MKRLLLKLLKWLGIGLGGSVLLYGMMLNMNKMFLIPETLGEAIIHLVGVMIPPLGGIFGYF